MQISSASSAVSGMGLQALRDLFQPAAETGAGQTLPSTPSRSSSLAMFAGPPPASLNGGGFNTGTMASLLGSQEAGSSPGDRLVGEVDTDGDSAISIEELAASLNTDAASLAQTFGEIDADGDGKVTGTELDSGLKAMFETNGPPPPPSESDIASMLMSAADTDSGGSLSLDEILSALGETDEDGAAETFAAYDADGDEALSSKELSAAIEAMISRQLSAYAAQGQQGDWTTSLAA